MTDNSQPKESRYLNLLSKLPVAVQECDIDGNITYANRHYEELFGYAPGEATRHTIFDRLADEQNRQELKNYLHYLADAQPAPMAFRNRNHKITGEEINIEIIWDYLHDTQGKVTGFSCVLSDITETVQLANALSEYHKAVESSDDLVAIVNSAYIYQRANQTYLDYYGKTREQVIGQHVATVMGKDAFEHILKPHLDRCLLGEKVGFERTLKAPELGIRYLEASYFPLHKLSSATTEILVIIKDVTERKLREQLLAARLKLIDTSLQGSEENLLRTFLDVTEALTDSLTSCLHFFSEEEQSFALKIWSSGTKRNREEDDDPNSPCPLKEAGVWEKILRQNKPQVYKDQTGCNHCRWLGLNPDQTSYSLLVPIVRSEKPIALLTLGKKIAYTEAEVRLVVELADQAWDIVARMQAESSLQETEALLKKSQEIAHVGSWQLEMKTNRLIWSDETYRIFGLQPNEFEASYDAFLAAIHPEDREKVNNAYLKSVKERRDGYQLEHRVIQKDSGAIRYVYEECRHYSNENGEIIRSIGTVQDITSRKQAESALNWELQVNEALAQLAGRLLDPHPEVREIAKMIFSCAQDLTNCKFGLIGEIEPVSLNFICYHFGPMMANPAEAANTDNNQLSFPINSDNIYPNLWGHTLNTGQAFYANNPAQHAASAGVPQGHIPVERFLAAPVLLGNEVIGQIALANPPGDFTDKQLEAIRRLADLYALALHRRRSEQLQAKLEEKVLQSEKMEAIGTLAGGIAHDFNNILMGLFGHMALAQKKLPAEHPSVKSLDKAGQSLDRATRLAKQLLTFAKGGEPIKGQIELASLIDEIVHFDLSGSNVKPVVTKSPGLWTADVDKGQMQQVFSNLAINAKHSMPDGGNLYVKLENCLLKQDNSLDLKAGQYVKVTIRDSGTGIAQKHLDRIFEPYFSTKQTGSGLGLAIVYSIVKQHGGRIEVDSVLGQGTTFAIYLPASDPTSAKQKPQVAKKTTSTNEPKKPMRILVMDDDEIILDLIKEILEQDSASAYFCYRVTCVRDGESAVKQYQDALQDGAPFGPVITDLTIPGGLGGKSSCDKILQFDPQACLIAMSGYANDPIMAKYQEYGFTAALPKPFTEEKLIKTLDRILPAKQHKQTDIEENGK